MFSNLKYFKVMNERVIIIFVYKSKYKLRCSGGNFDIGSLF